MKIFFAIFFALQEFAWDCSAQGSNDISSWNVVQSCAPAGFVTPAFCAFQIPQVLCLPPQFCYTTANVAGLSPGIGEALGITFVCKDLPATCSSRLSTTVGLTSSTLPTLTPTISTSFAFTTAATLSTIFTTASPVTVFVPAAGPSPAATAAPSGRSGIVRPATIGPPDCFDRNSQCSNLASQGRCQTDTGVMFVLCRKTCGCPTKSGQLPQNIAGQFGTGPAVFVQPGQAQLFSGPIAANCVDSNALCPYWASIGECSTNGPYMSRTCVGACSAQCQASAVQPAQCANVDPNCSTWVTAGECTKNPFYMQWRCRKACGLC